MFQLSQRSKMSSWVGKGSRSSGEGYIKPESEKQVSLEMRRKVRLGGDDYSFQGRRASQGSEVKHSLVCVCLCVCVCMCVCVCVCVCVGV